MKELRKYKDYRIVMNGEDFEMYKGDEILLTSMSLNKVDRYWDEVLMYCDAD